MKLIQYMNITKSSNNATAGNVITIIIIAMSSITNKDFIISSFVYTINVSLPLSTIGLGFHNDKELALNFLSAIKISLGKYLHYVNLLEFQSYW